MTFDEYYKKPLELDEYGETVYTRDGVDAFHFVVTIDITEARHVVDIINDKCENDLNYNLVYRDGIIYKDKICDGNEYIYLAGWYELLRICGMDTRKTSKIQKDFGNYLIKKLSNNENN